jgi:hypothetical protein
VKKGGGFQAMGMSSDRVVTIVLYS